MPLIAVERVNICELKRKIVTENFLFSSFSSCLVPCALIWDPVFVLTRILNIEFCFDGVKILRCCIQSVFYDISICLSSGE